MSTKPPSGTRDFLPDDVRRREHVIGVVRGVYERYGFEPLETPAFENIETLLGKYGEEGNKLIFKILKRGEHEASGEADLALRYDLTVPLARVVAQYQNELPKFFKRYQIQPVWRADRPARGPVPRVLPVRHRCDRLDVAGGRGRAAVGGHRGARRRSGFSDFTIRLNHRVLLTALLEAAGVPAAAARRGAGGDRQAGQDRPRRRARRSWSRAASTDEQRVPTCSRWRSTDVPALDATGRRRSSSGQRRQDASVDRDLAARRRHAGAGACQLRSRAWRAGCHTTRARSWRSPCPIWPAASAAAAGTTTRRHVPRPRHAGVRVLARPRAHHRRHDRAADVPGRRSRAAASDVMVTLWNDESRARCAGARRGAAAAAACAWTSIPRRTSSGKQFKYASSRARAVRGNRRRRRAGERHRQRQGPAQRRAGNHARAAAAAYIAHPRERSNPEPRTLNLEPS